MAGFGDLLQSLMGIGGSTPDAIMAQSIDPSLAEGRSAAPSPAGAPAAGPATTIAGAQGAAAGGQPPQAAPGAGQPIGGPTTPPDLSALYQKLVTQQRHDQGINQGLSLIAAGFAHPENRAALIASGNASTGPDPAAALQTMMTLRNDAVKQQQLVAGRAQLPDIAKRYNMPLATVQQMYEAGKLPEFIGQQEKSQVISSDKGGINVVKPAAGIVTNLKEGVDKDETSTAEKKLNAMQENWQKYNLPDPSNPANAQFWKDTATKIFTPGGGQTVNVGENAMDKFTAEHVYGPAAAAGTAALDANHTLSTMKNLALQGGDDIPSGPASLIDLKSRQALSSMLGVNIEGMQEAEGIQKLNQALATASVKAISSRPTQMEFAKALENNPGILQSRAGMMMMIEILKQDNQAKAGIGSMALDPKNHGSAWIQKVDDYYASHPLISPFDKSRPFGKEDLEILGDSKRTKIDGGKMYYQKDGKWFTADSAT